MTTPNTSLPSIGMLAEYSSLKILELTTVSLTTEEFGIMCNSLAKHRCLQRLCLNEVTFNTPHAFGIGHMLGEALGLCKSIQTLYFASVPIADDDMPPLVGGISDIAGLRTLTFKECDFTSTGVLKLVKAFRNHPSLRLLTLENLPERLTEETMVTIKNLMGSRVNIIV